MCTLSLQARLQGTNKEWMYGFLCPNKHPMNSIGVCHWMSLCRRCKSMGVLLLVSTQNNLLGYASYTCVGRCSLVYYWMLGCWTSMLKSLDTSKMHMCNECVCTKATIVYVCVGAGFGGVRRVNSPCITIDMDLMTRFKWPKVYHVVYITYISCDIT